VTATLVVFAEEKFWFGAIASNRLGIGGTHCLAGIVKKNKI
jgi:hypothetical protein